MDHLPNADLYEISFMHRDVVTHIVVTASEFIITGSNDGHIKFWKKQPIGIEFVKHFRAHLGPIVGLSATSDGLYSCSVSTDQTLKTYDVFNFGKLTIFLK